MSPDIIEINATFKQRKTKKLMATNPCREAQQFNGTHTVSFCGLIEVRVNGLTPIDEFFQNQYLIDTNIATPNGFSQLIPGVCRVGLKKWRECKYKM